MILLYGEAYADDGGERFTALDTDKIAAGLAYAEVAGKWRYVGQRLAVLEAHLTAREAWRTRPAAAQQPVQLPRFHWHD